MDNNRLAQQIQFIIEIDKLKNILRQTLLTDESRRENSAEHSWHLAMMAIVLSEYAPSEDINLLRVIKMLLIHDLVEIDAGDTFCYDLQANQNKAAREVQAATRLFGMLPEQGVELRELWQEFETQQTIEAQFAAALDRLQPLLHNQQTKGGTWRIHGINRAQVLQRMSPVKDGAPALWQLVEKVIEDAVAAGYLSE